MLRLKDRTAAESLAFHVANRPSPRFVETSQQGRILLTRRVLGTLLADLNRRCKIIEPGCGRADISGWFSADHDVIGYECGLEAVAGAKSDWPQMDVRIGDAQTVEPEDCDVVILTEFLEHIADPLGMVKRWLPKARYSVISSPLEGDRGEFQESGHIWSFDREDFDAFFDRGGHELIEWFDFEMSIYKMFLGLGKRRSG